MKVELNSNLENRFTPGGFSGKNQVYKDAQGKPSTRLVEPLVDKFIPQTFDQRRVHFKGEKIESF